MKKVFLSLIACASLINGDPTDIIRVHSSSVVPHPSLGAMCVAYNSLQFTVFHEGKSKKVLPHDVDPLLRQLPSDLMKKFLSQGKLKVNRYNNGDYSIQSLIPGQAGGIALANFGYFLIKSVGYTLPVVVTVTAFTQGVDVSPTWQFAGKITGKFLNKKAIEVVTRAATDTAGKTGAKVGAEVSKAVVKELGTKTTTELVTSVAATSGGYFAAVETIANAAYIILLAVPGP